MPELTAIHVGLLVLLLIIGTIVGWIVRGDRCAREKIAVNAGWQDQLESQQSEHNRLAEQNRSLMEQIAQYQAAHKDHSNRARELSDSLKEAFARRDELQRQLKDTRSNLEVAIAQRNRLQSQNPKVHAAALKEKDDKIFRLSRELTSWQSRVPPLVQRYQQRDKEARRYEDELRKVQVRLQALEDLVRSDQTRIEPVDAESLPDGGDASNEANASTAEFQTANLQDQIEPTVDEPVVGTQPDARFAETSDQTGNQASDETSDETSDAAIEDQIDDSAQHRAADSPQDRLEDPLQGPLKDQLEDQLEDRLQNRPQDQVAKSVQDQPDRLDAPRPDAKRAHANDEFVPVAEFDDPGGESVLADDAFAAVFADAPDNDDQSGEDGAEPQAMPPIDAAHSHNDVDNLQLIKGIGPAIEKMLQQLGISRFHQIAEMSEYDIDRVAQQLKGFRSRIYREDWIGQARDLQFQKSRDPS